jgi:hypothetical protein
MSEYDSLVERVSTAIALEDEKHYWPEARGAVETDMARSAIREVAIWLEEEFGPQIDWITTELREEAGND